MQIGSTKVQCSEDSDSAATIFFYTDSSCQSKVQTESVQTLVGDDGVAIPSGCYAINQNISYTTTCSYPPGGDNFPTFAIVSIIVFVCLCCFGGGTYYCLRSKRRCWFAEKRGIIIISQGTEMRQSYRINDGQVTSPIILQGNSIYNILKNLC